MIQSRRMSVIETTSSTAIGYVVALTTQIIVFPWFGVTVSVGQNLTNGAIFTVVSIIRGYAVRRLFNWIGARIAAGDA